MEVKKILVIDDRPEFGRVLREQLGNPSSAGIWTSRPETALSELGREVPDLIVLDLLSQEGNGKNELEQSLLNDPRLAGKCVVTVSPVSRKVMYRAPKGLPVHVVITPRPAKAGAAEGAAKTGSGPAGLIGMLKRLIWTGVQA
jgi:CheY-like chemotaxis protein